MNSNDLVHELGKYRLFVCWDDEPFDPREQDNLGTMACFHGRYNFGDKNIPFGDYNFCNWTEMRNHLALKIKAVAVLPIYLYDHSGQTIATTPFHCPWDSGQIGFIYCTKADIRQWQDSKRCTQKMIDQAPEILQAEVDEYNDYINGDTYRWVIQDSDNDWVDGCSSFNSKEEAEEDGRATMENYHENETRIREQQQQHVIYLHS